MRIVDRYILKSIVFTFLITIFVFCLLFILVDSASNLDEFIDRKATIEVIARYYLSYLPVIIVQTASIACLISCLLTFASLNTHNELIALRAGGMNFWKLARPALCFGLLISAATFYLNERYIPLAESLARQIKEENLSLDAEQSSSKAKIRNLSFYGLKNRLYFIDSFDPVTFDLEGVTIISFDNLQNIKEKVVALEGSWTGLAWKFKQVHITPYQQIEEGPTQVKVYEEKLMDIKETPKDFLRQRTNVRFMNLRQLREYIDRFSNSGAIRAVDSLKVDFFEKIAFPLTPVILLLLGLPLVMATGNRKAQNFAALGIAIAIGFLYYVANAVGIALGKGGFLPPEVAANIAPFFFSLAAFYFIRTHF